MIRSAPAVSVAMAVHNGAASIGRAVDSIRLQTLEDWELIVVDDRSADDSARIAESRGDARICVVRNERNLGLAASLNVALDAARGRYIARIDADDVAFPERLARQAMFLDGHPDTHLVGCAALMFRGDGVPVGVMRVPTTHAAIARRPQRGFPLYHPTWMARTGWLRGLRYDERFRKAQDFELLLRSHAQARLANLDEVLLGYRYEAGSLAKRIATRRFAVHALAKNHASLGAMKALAGVGSQGAKGLLDMALAATGLAATRDRMKCAPASPELLREWEAHWRRLGAETSPCAA